MTNRTLLAEARTRGLSVLHSLMVADLLEGEDRLLEWCRRAAEEGRSHGRPDAGA